ncbi:MAG: thioredoxin domain-containing protein [Bacteroidetes Order II. Incertae sedis bacterium]|nr:thioredoxin domain-containing protein [Bacteroidetes Order II. bacterium]
MINPHGSADLMPLYVSDQNETKRLLEEAKSLPSLLVNSAVAANAVMLGAGYFTPLKGYMNLADTMSIAEDMGWDREAFATCMVRPDVHQRVLDDLEYGRATQLSSTPTVFINGRKVTYWRNTDFIRAVVQEELSRL